LKLLSEITEQKTNKNQPIFYPNEFMLYYDKERKENYFNLLEYPGTTGKFRLRSYEIKSDAFTFIRYDGVGSCKHCALRGSIDGDSIPDVVGSAIIWENGVKKYFGYVYSGNPIYNDQPRAYFQYPKCDSYESVCYIGDVTGDGIGDIAYGCSDGDFRIFKGVDWRKVSVEESKYPKFTLHQTEPNPISADGKAVLPITLAHSGVYTLEVYDLSGERVGELFKGDLPSGEVRLPFTVKSLTVSSGMYTLHLSDGKYSREHAFVISK